MKGIGQFVTVLLVVGLIGAYFWPITATIAAFGITYYVVLRTLESRP